MKKLNLKLDELQVESFDTMGRGTGRRGTVNGHMQALSAACADTNVCVESDGCPVTGLECTNDTSWQQCGYSFGGTCGASPPYSYDGGCDGGVAARGFSPPVCG